MVSTPLIFYKIIDQLEKFDFIFNPPERFFEDVPLEKIMKISQVKKAMLSGIYEFDYWQFICDVHLSLRIVEENTTKKSPRLKKVIEAKKYVDDEMDNFMKQKGYCCGHWYISKAKAVNCSGLPDDECLVKDGGIFYRYDRFTFCEEHMRQKFEDSQLLEMENHVLIDRTEMVKYVFQSELTEGFVKCNRCMKLFHERCVLHLNNSHATFICKLCRRPYDIRFQKLSAKSIPQTDCDMYLLKFMRMCFKDFPPSITIRMLSNETTSFNIGKVYQVIDDEIQENIPYQNLTLFAFLEDPEYGEMIFFTMFVHLYGDYVPDPMRRSAYISFIDSAKFYPGKRRTELYQLMILGFFSYIKKFGYKRVFIWSVPPNDDTVDYVLPFKPQTQRTPTSEILDKWYATMIDKGKTISVNGKEKVVKESYKVVDYAELKNWKEISTIPLFDDDIWIRKLNEKIAEIEKAHQQDLLKYRLSSAVPHINKKEVLWNEMKVELEMRNENYFIVLLDTSDDIKRKPSELQQLERTWVNNRHLLIDFFCDNKLMFCDKRQASFATYSFLYRILLENGNCRMCADGAHLNPYLLCPECEQDCRDSLKLRKEITLNHNFK